MATGGKEGRDQLGGEDTLCCCSVARSCLTLCDPWAVAQQATLSVGFSRQEYCSGLPFPSPEDLPHPGAKPAAPGSQTGRLPLSPLGSRPLVVCSF